MAGKLTLVPTPIGNLQDMTFRAIEVLKSADAILAEDTRNSGFLLKHFDISTPMISHHKFNEHKTAPALADQMLGGKHYAMITDAGTPAISDPGYLLVKSCTEKGVTVECLPGATAFIPALAVSGLPNDRFVFEGFLPHKKGRTKRITALAEEERSMVFYESPYRLIKLLEQLADVFGYERKASVSREISKQFEETKRGTLSDLAAHFNQNKIKGEFVVVVEGKTTKKNGNEIQ
ncbi:MAG TPA: 16S rRNA (cytidine(1402)-2'-O)-methyltransferase [Bacteroidales bacterium]|nr:16S rRNA (cytidine(1402)-2'-O)-methyltransferase [Bacteroidales bacterium]